MGQIQSNTDRGAIGSSAPCGPSLFRHGTGSSNPKPNCSMTGYLDQLSSRRTCAPQQTSFSTIRS
jgi:hypothetical protein